MIAKKKKKRRKNMNSQLLNAIQRRCTQKKKSLLRSLVSDGFTKTECPTQGNAYYFKDNGGNVLLVAHADTVQKGLRFSKNENIIFSPMLDDRLGVALVADYLPSVLSAPVDILITDDEECGNSSARSFVSPKEYNWIAEMDRGGGDVVTYCLDSPDWNSALESAGFTIGSGIYSDICELTDTCCMVNVGIGYDLYHSAKAYANTDTLQQNLVRFVTLFDAYCNQMFEQDASQYQFDKFVEPAGTESYGYGWQCRCDECESMFYEPVIDSLSEEYYCPVCYADFDWEAWITECKRLDSIYNEEWA